MMHPAGEVTLSRLVDRNFQRKLYHKRAIKIFTFPTIASSLIFVSHHTENASYLCNLEQVQCWNSAICPSTQTIRITPPKPKWLFNNSEAIRNDSNLLCVLQWKFFHVSLSSIILWGELNKNIAWRKKKFLPVLQFSSLQWETLIRELGVFRWEGCSRVYLIHYRQKNTRF